MTRICAWCGDELPPVNSDGTEGISHGICGPCVREHFPEIADKVLRKAA